MSNPRALALRVFELPVHALPGYAWDRPQTLCLPAGQSSLCHHCCARPPCISYREHAFCSWSCGMAAVGSFEFWRFRYRETGLRDILSTRKVLSKVTARMLQSTRVRFNDKHQTRYRAIPRETISAPEPPKTTELPIKRPKPMAQGKNVMDRLGFLRS